MNKHTEKKVTGRPRKIGPQSTLQDAIDYFGSLGAVAEICGVTYIAVGKWRDKGHLPLTEFYQPGFPGHTNHAEKIAKASRGKFSRKALLDDYYKNNRNAA